MKSLMILAWLALLTGCGAPSDAPAGWQAVAGQPATWSHADALGTQRYSVVRKAFDGGLHALASQVTVNAVLGARKARLLSSLPFPPCPGMAGILTLALPGRPETRIEIGFAVRRSREILATYTRPAAAPVDPAVEAARSALLCKAPF